MDSYIIYKCLECNKHFVLFTNEVEHSEQESMFITCPYHGKHKRIIVINRFESLKDCMDHDSYKRVKGSIKQTKWSR